MTTSLHPPDGPPPAIDAGFTVPYLVYGTLRPGGSNAHLIGRHGATHGGSSTLDGYAMYDALAGYPYVVPDVGARTVALDIVLPPADAAAARALRADLDALEGFEGAARLNHYERVAVPFAEPGTGRSRWGWLYVAGAGALIDGLARIESGDWFRR
ncbi:gamma-glutamylcyclotransferase family protein [Demequina sp. SO4-13]|uniref:gamma-glutamylcyclotransferase family protein n=1 Tax=Demequina sp. SO4-13 TaxID=3401027 RepID=UPI003AF635F3